MSKFKRSPLSKTMTFRMTEEEHAFLTEQATKRNTEVVELIREALDDYFENHSSPRAQNRRRPSGSAGSKG